MQHSYVKHVNCDRSHCPICDGGLMICRVCTAAEGELTKECPGVVVPFDRREAVYHGKYDFYNGEWYVL